MHVLAIIALVASTAVSLVLSQPQQPLDFSGMVADRAPDDTQYAGVAVVTILGSPRWFQNRYSMLINFVHSQLPPGWIIQMVHKTNKMALECTNYPGIQNLVTKGALRLTPLPQSMQKIKRKELMLSTWLWENLLANKVLVFGGNQVICSNSIYKLQDFMHFDYIGGPWSSYGGAGGEGGLSLRTREVMLRAVNFIHSRNQGKDMALQRGDDAMVVEAIILLMQEDAVFRDNVNLAQAMDTYMFVRNDYANNLRFLEIVRAQQKAFKEGKGKGRRDYAQESQLQIHQSGIPLGTTGTLGGWNDTARIEHLEACPEMKVFFPVLHNGACFGANPDPLGCFKYLCEQGGLKCRQSATKGALSTQWESKGEKLTLTLGVG